MIDHPDHRRIGIELNNALCDRIADEGDQNVLEAELVREPWFGLT